MDLSSFLTTEFIFASVPPVETNIYLPFSIFFGLLILSGIALQIFLKNQDRKIWGRYITPLLLTGTLGLMHLGARYEQLPWLASRFFLTLVMTTMFAWFIILAITVSRLLPIVKKEQEVNKRFDKYLPKSRR